MATHEDYLCGRQHGVVVVLLAHYVAYMPRYAMVVNYQGGAVLMKENLIYIMKFIEDNGFKIINEDVAIKAVEDYHIQIETWRNRKL
mgnify:CR=1 FL=1